MAPIRGNPEFFKGAKVDLNNLKKAITKKAEVRHSPDPAPAHCGLVQWKVFFHGPPVEPGL
jgi:hypothetical protein